MAVKISAYRILMEELLDLTKERHPINMFNPFRSDHSPLSDKEYIKISGSVNTLRSFMKGGAIYGKGEPINTGNLAINNVYTITDILTARKDEVLSELENVLDVFKSHKIMPALYDTFNKVFDQMDLVPSKDTKDNDRIHRWWQYSWEDIKEKKAAGSNWHYH